MNHLSPSQINMALRCGEQYRRRYIEGERVPPSIALLKGSGVHRGAETNYRQKIESHADLKQEDIVDASVAGFEEAKAKQGLLLTPDETTEGVENVVGRATDSVANLAVLYVRDIAPTVQPVLVEEKIEIAIPNAEYTLLGVLDCADEAGYVRDLKTSGKKKSQAEADTSMQLTAYWLAYRAKTGKEPAGVVLDCLIETKKAQSQRLVSVRDVSDVAVLAALFGAVENMLKAGTFMPNPNGWHCSARFCGYWPDCVYSCKRKGGLSDE